ncbi:MAG: putative toxin-antitoxin system toxin component, PIN family [Bacteroidales bacterium]|nr:putative toxin-antitoxin system toxin component, PIN family [Bacteroidales bacterium]
MKKKIFAVVDTNVIVSGMITSNSASPTAKVLDCLGEKHITPLYCEEILQEYENVLGRERFHLPKEKIEKFLKMMKSDGIASSRVPSSEVSPDPKDVVFYEVALSKEDSFLVTGNIKHFPKIDMVVTPAEMMEIIKRNQEE